MHVHIDLLMLLKSLEKKGYCAVGSLSDNIKDRTFSLKRIMNLETQL